MTAALIPLHTELHLATDEKFQKRSNRRRLRSWWTVTQGDLGDAFKTGFFEALAVREAAEKQQGRTFVFNPPEHLSPAVVGRMVEFVLIETGMVSNDED